MSLYSSAMGTSAMKDALSIISRVTLPFSSAMAHSTPGRRVEVNPKREQTARKALRSSMKAPSRCKVEGHYKTVVLGFVGPIQYHRGTMTEQGCRQSGAAA